MLKPNIIYSFIYINIYSHSKFNKQEKRWLVKIFEISFNICYLFDRQAIPTEEPPWYRDFIVVAWEVPESDGGSPITQYKVEPRSTTKNSWIIEGTTKADTLTIKASKLTERHEYDFWVVAENDIGVSNPCQTEAPFIAKLPFGE